MTLTQDKPSQVANRYVGSRSVPCSILLYEGQILRSIDCLRMMSRGRSLHNPLSPIKTEMQLRLIDQAMVNGIQRQLEAVGDAELVKDIVQVILDGLFGDKKLFANFLVAEALGDELNDFFLAVAEQRLFAARPGFAGLRKRLHDFGSHAIVEPDFARVNAMDTFHQEIGGGLLQHNTSRAKAHGSDHVEIIFRSDPNHIARKPGD